MTELFNNNGVKIIFDNDRQVFIVGNSFNDMVETSNYPDAVMEAAQMGAFNE